jgi:hypothetical protein
VNSYILASNKLLEGRVVYRLPVGISDFKDMCCVQRRNAIYYIDKTAIVHDIMQEESVSILFTRPIRFMKSTNLSMLNYFFNIEDATDNKILFDRLAIATKPEYQHTWKNHQGQYPVIFFSLKDIRGNSWAAIEDGLIRVVKQLYQQYEFLGNSPHLSQYNKMYYQAIATGDGELLSKATSAISKPDAATLSNSYKTALFTLTELLAKHYQRQVIVLVDEYDKPLHIAYQHTDPTIRYLPKQQQQGSCFYETTEWMITFFESGLKDNNHVRKAVMTGVLRTAFTSLISSLNHVSVYSVLSSRYAQYFGVTDSEIPDVLQALGFEKMAAAQQQRIKQWYNGYRIGNTLLHNPWSIAKYLTDAQDDPTNVPIPYWLQVGDSSLIGEFGRRYYPYIEEDLTQLLKNSLDVTNNPSEVVVFIDERTVFSDLDTLSVEAFWSLLLHTGFITLRSKAYTQGTLLRCSIAIPNFEIAGAYYVFIKRWFKEANQPSSINLALMLESLLSGELEYFKTYLTHFIFNTVSYFDFPTFNIRQDPNQKTPPERVYHIFMIGLLAGLQDYGYRLQSNHESGLGRYDLLLTPEDHSKHGVIFEFKVADYAEQLAASAQSALQQIVEKKYNTALARDGVKRGLHIGLSFYGKEFHVAHEWHDY